MIGIFSLSFLVFSPLSSCLFILTVPSEAIESFGKEEPDEAAARIPSPPPAPEYKIGTFAILQNKYLELQNVLSSRIQILCSFDSTVFLLSPENSAVFVFFNFCHFITFSGSKNFQTKIRLYVENPI